MRLCVVLVVSAALPGAACTTTTVTLNSGGEVTGKLVAEADGYLTLRGPEWETEPPADAERPGAPGGTEVALPGAPARIPYTDAQLVEEEDSVAFGFAIAGSVIATLGLVMGVGGAIDEATSDDAFSDLGVAAAIGSGGIVVLLGLAIAVPSWIAWGNTRRTRTGEQLRAPPGGVALTF